MEDYTLRLMNWKPAFRLLLPWKILLMQKNWQNGSTGFLERLMRKTASCLSGDTGFRTLFQKLPQNFR